MKIFKTGVDIENGPLHLREALVNATGDVLVRNTSTGRIQSRTISQLMADLGILQSAIHVQSVASTTWTFTHNLNIDSPGITVWNSSNRVVIPSEIERTSSNTVVITFPSAISGRAIALGGAFSDINSQDSNIVNSIIFG